MITKQNKRYKNYYAMALFRVLISLSNYIASKEVNLFKLWS